MSTTNHVSNIRFLEFWIFLVWWLQDTFKPMMHFRKITLYNVIAHGKRDDNIFYGSVITLASWGWGWGGHGDKTLNRFVNP
jgi:hypothetical protein